MFLLCINTIIIIYKKVKFKMSLLKKLVLAFFVSFAMLATAPSVMAAKVANQTQAEVEQSLTDTVTVAEETLAAMKSGADKDTVLALIKKTKQTAKTIESSVVLAKRDRALSKVAKARGAYKKDQHEKAEELMEQAVKGFKDVKTLYHNF
jgi:vacuolar-type H+-ATPase subunit E/Vma4